MIVRTHYFRSSGGGFSFVSRTIVSVFLFSCRRRNLIKLSLEDCVLRFDLIFITRDQCQQTFDAVIEQRAQITLTDKRAE